MSRSSNILVVAGAVLVLGAFSILSLVLHSNVHFLSEQDAGPWFGARGRRYGGVTALAPPAQPVEAVVEAQKLADVELQLVEKSISLADQVEKLAKKLQGRKERWTAQAEKQGFAIAEAKAKQPPAYSTILDNRRRKELVVEAMRHSWKWYERHAYGRDELMPLSHAGKDSFGGLGATMVDALDTLWLMDLKTEFWRARDWVANNLTFDRHYDASVFETTIRIVGGLLSAHQLSGDPIFLSKAKELEDILLHAYDTPTGIPYNTINLKTKRARNPTWNRRSSTLSEYGTQQLELLTLANLTGVTNYTDKCEAPIRYLNEHHSGKGLLPLYINPSTGQFTTEKISLGAEGDSYYEYLLKVWILKGKKDDMYRDMWVRAMDDAIGRTSKWHAPSSLSYLAELDRHKVRNKMDHLACFVPAMLALGAHAGAVQGEQYDLYMTLARNLTRTCWEMYNQMPTGVAPEFVEFPAGGRMRAGSRGKHNLLRPEALEAMYIMWRVTGHSRYREWGWQMFSGFLRWCRVEQGFAGLKDVTVVPPDNDDTMQSFWLAETLKYAFLLFGPADVLPLTDWVLNTEAHPLRVLQDGLHLAPTPRPAADVTPA